MASDLAMGGADAAESVEVAGEGAPSPCFFPVDLRLGLPEEDDFAGFASLEAAGVVIVGVAAGASTGVGAGADEGEEERVGGEDIELEEQLKSGGTGTKRDGEPN